MKQYSNIYAKGFVAKLKKKFAKYRGDFIHVDRKKKKKPGR